LTRRSGFLRNATFEAFVDGGVVDSAAVVSASRKSAVTTLWDVGVGVVFQSTIHQLSWTTRFEVPFMVNRFNFAADDRPSGRQGFRWSVSLAPSF